MTPLWHKADIAKRSTNVRFWGLCGHCSDIAECPLMTLTGSRVPSFAVTHNGTAPLSTDVISYGPRPEGKAHEATRVHRANWQRSRMAVCRACATASNAGDRISRRPV